MSSYVYERIEHGPKCPIHVFTTSINHSRYHWHYDYELILVLKGELIVNTRHGQVQLKKGDIYLLNSISVHELHGLNKDNICLFLQINPHLFADEQDYNKSYFFYLNSSEAGKLPKNGYDSYKILAALISLEYEKPSPNMYRVNAYVYNLIADFFDYLVYDIHQQSSLHKATTDIEVLMDIIQYVQDHFRDKDIYENLRKMFGMSDKTLYRFLKNHMGISPKVFILNTRINASKEMLRSTDKTIPFISSACGFSAENTFYRVFKKEVGITPNDYRNTEIASKSDIGIQGYLSFNHKEAYQLLKNIVKEKD